MEFFYLAWQDEVELKLKDAHSSLDELDMEDLYVRYKVGPVFVILNLQFLVLHFLL